MTTSLNNILPEIYPIIAAHLPLYATSSTLLALALTNHHISEIVLPLLCSRLVLKNEKDAILILQKLLDDPTFGCVVRELHIMSDLSADIRNQDPPSDVIRRVEDVISKGYLPFIHTLGLHIMHGWYYGQTEDGYKRIIGFGQIRKEFLEQLKEKCPRLRGLILNGFSDCPDGPWLEELGSFQDITSFTIRFRRTGLRREPSDKLIRHVLSLAPSLHTLDLSLPGRSDLTSTSPIFKIDLPFLQSLSLASFDEVDTKLVMAFLKRHPSIKYLDLDTNIHWFVSEPPQNFLPNLLHLGAHWNEVRFLAPILHQLFSLSIRDSVDGQIPYLLRFILPKGLPNLKSLDIGHAALLSRHNNNIEGSLWYESEDGTFHWHQAETKKEPRTVFDGFMHSIVRATPNLEELGFHNSFLQLSKFVPIADDLNSLPYLRHLYYRGYDEGLGTEERNAFVFHARDLAEVVPGLMSITNMADYYYPPYLTAKIRRKENGEVIDIEVGKGYGMKIGHDDEAFPCATQK